MELSRRDFLRLSTGALAGGVLGTLGMSLYEPHETVVTRLDVMLRRLPPAFDGLRIAQLSDIHFGSYMTSSHLERVVGLTNAQEPDVVVLTGDFVTSGLYGKRKKLAEHAWPCGDVLRHLNAPLGCFAVLGNHDHGTNAAVVTEALSSGSRIQVLRNRALPLERDGARVWVAGVDDVTMSRSRPEEALRTVPEQECTVVAVHEPDFADEMRKYPVDLQISGHSHGGQIRLPGFGALFLPYLAWKYPAGHYQIGELQLYTNRGIGVIGVPMRLMCTPEVTLLTLKVARDLVV